MASDSDRMKAFSGNEPLATGKQPRVLQGRAAKKIGRLIPAAVTVAAFVVAGSRIDLGDAIAAARNLPVTTLINVFAVLLLGSALACLRLWFIAGDMGRPVRFRDAIVATMSGQLAGAVFFQIIGQTIARSAILSKADMPVAATIALTGYERLVAAAISFAFALAGGWYLFGHIALDLQAGGDEFLRLGFGLAMVTVSGALFVWGRLAARTVHLAFGARSIPKLARIVTVSVAIQAATMAGYMLAERGLWGSTPLIDLVAATAIVMLAASLPISLAGWGIREVSAVYALGALGLPYGVALVVALLIGAVSILVTAALLLVGLLWRTVPARAGSTTSEYVASIDYLAFLSWLLPILAASMVVFQVHVPIGQNLLNINLADSLVLFGAALFLLPGLMRNRALPVSRLPHLGIYLGLMSLVVILAFLHGWNVIGWTSWAFTNRLFGWLVLLAYLATGGLLTRQAGKYGLKLLLKTFAVAGLAAATIDLIFMTAFNYGITLPIKPPASRIEAFAQNPNALAFQLLLVVICIFSTERRGRVWYGVLALALMELFFAGSRAGWGAFLLVATAAWWLGSFRPRQLLTAIALAAIGVALVDGSLFRVMPFLGVEGAPSRIGNVIQQIVTDDDTERWVSLGLGFRMFVDHPVFGAGLGVFIETYFREHGRQLLIHSTPLWLLAEAGIAGLLVFVAPFCALFWHELRQRTTVDPARTVLLLTIILFAAMSSVHELLYQRAMWLVLGAALFYYPGAKDLKPPRSAESGDQT